jgi:hypothetical protein
MWVRRSRKAIPIISSGAMARKKKRLSGNAGKKTVNIGEFFMEIIQGILVRLWCSCGLVVFIGAFCLLILWVEKEKKTEIVVTGYLCILLGLGMGIWYSHALLNTKEQTVSGTFLYDQKKTDALPPLALCREYFFEIEQGETVGLYMDSYVKKQLYPNGFEAGMTYWITYEERTDLILEIEDK